METQAEYRVSDTEPEPPVFVRMYACQDCNRAIGSEYRYARQGLVLVMGVMHHKYFTGYCECGAVITWSAPDSAWRKVLRSRRHAQREEQRAVQVALDEIKENVAKAKIAY